MERKTRLLFEFLTVELKKEVLPLLIKDRDELYNVFNKNGDSYPSIVKQVLSGTLDKWNLEIEELEFDIKNNIGAIRS